MKVTVSLGVTGYQQGERISEKAHVIALADKALYISKLSGRKKVTAVQ